MEAAHRPPDPDEVVHAAKAVRDALAALGLFMAPMLPGEEKHDGRTPETHYVFYLALLAGRVEAMRCDLAPEHQADFEELLKISRDVH